MSGVKHRITAALNDRRGLTAMEYGVMAVGIVLTLSVAAAALGTNISTLYTNLATYL